jgi:hypothetical protein
MNLEVWEMLWNYLGLFYDANKKSFFVIISADKL